LILEARADLGDTRLRLVVDFPLVVEATGFLAVFAFVPVDGPVFAFVALADAGALDFVAASDESPALWPLTGTPAISTQSTPAIQRDHMGAELGEAITLISSL
jgi:hypothetical protein